MRRLGHLLYGGVVVGVGAVAATVLARSVVVDTLVEKRLALDWRHLVAGVGCVRGFAYHSEAAHYKFGTQAV